MFVLRLIAGLLFITIPMLITGLICIAYIGLFGWLLLWIGSYDAAVAIMLTPFAIAGFIALSVVAGGALIDNEALEQWCVRNADKVFPPPEAPAAVRQG